MKTFIVSIIVIVSVFCRYSFTQWQNDVRLTNNPAVSQTSFNYGWSIASSGDTLHLQFFDERNGGYTQIYYMRSLNKGITWSAETRLSNSNTFAERGSIAVNGLNVHEVWQDMRNGWEIYYRRSTDAGSSWLAETRLTTDAGNSWAPGVYVSGQTVHVLWSESRDGNMEAYYKRSSDNGVTWSADIRLTNNSAYSWYPCAAIQGNVIHVFWSDDRDINGVFQVYYKRSLDAGLNWGNDVRITNTGYNAQNPSAAVNGSNLYIAWSDNRDTNFEIYTKRSTNDGISWGADTRLTYASGDSYNPSLVVSGNFLHLTWEDTRNGNYEIYYKKSTNNGNGWNSDTRLTNASGDSRYASVITSGPAVHVAWFDERDGNREIYYKRDPAGNQSISIPIAPVLISPPNNSFNQAANIRFTWNKVLYADSYRLQIATDSSFNNLFINDSTLTDSTLVVANFTINSYYWWRVNAKNFLGTGPYSLKWKFGTFLSGLQPISLDIPQYFSLQQNYPNPFNPSTKIKFEIPLSRGVSEGRGVLSKLSIFDILGREVRTLVFENLKPGVYEVEFNAEALPSGVFFYKLTAGEFAETKKMILLK